MVSAEVKANRAIAMAAAGGNPKVEQGTGQKTGTYKMYKSTDKKTGWTPQMLDMAIDKFQTAVGKTPEVAMCKVDDSLVVRGSLAVLGLEETIQVLERKGGEAGNLVLGINFDQEDWPNEDKMAITKEEIEVAKKERKTAQKTREEAKVKEKAEKAPKVAKEKVVKEPKLNRNLLGLCWCGCGGHTKVDSKFLPGHDGRLNGRLTRYEAGDEQKGGGDVPENWDWLVDHVVPLLPACSKCGKPFMAAHGHDGVGPYCHSLDNPKPIKEKVAKAKAE